MNEAIRHRELKITLICKTCENQYGKWRSHCPVCRTPTPKTEEFNTPRVVVARKQRDSKSQCIFCRHRGAKHECPHCNEKIHRTCLGLHAPECQQFQIEREKLIKQLGADQVSTGIKNRVCVPPCHEGVKLVAIP